MQTNKRQPKPHIIKIANTKWIINLNIKYIKPLGENRGENLRGLWLGKGFPSLTPKTQFIKEKNQLGLPQNENFYSVKDTIKDEKASWEKILTNCISDKLLI